MIYVIVRTKGQRKGEGIQTEDTRQVNGITEIQWFITNFRKNY